MKALQEITPKATTLQEMIPNKIISQKSIPKEIPEDLISKEVVGTRALGLLGSKAWRNGRQG